MSSNWWIRNSKNLKEELTDYILHHVKDSHDFSLLSYTDEETGGKVYVGIPLPVILWDDGIKIFSSSRFNHGESIAEIEDNFYNLFQFFSYLKNCLLW